MCKQIGVLAESIGMTEMLARGRQVLAAQPFSVLLGAELLDFSEVGAELNIPIRDEMKQHIVVHAGRSQAVCRCDVYASSGGKESLCATAQGTIAKLGPPPGSKL